MKKQKLIFVSKGKNFLKDKCQICKKEIKKDDLVVVIVFSRYYSIIKSIWIAHVSCFLKEVKELFDKEIKLTEEGKKLILIEDI